MINSFITCDKALRGTLCNSTIKDHTSHAARYRRNSHTKQGLQKHVFLRPKTQYPLHKKAPLDNPERLSKSYIPVLQASGKADGLRTVGLLGTKYTMQEDFYLPRLEAAGVRVLLPEASEMEEVNRIIYEELCVGTVKESSRDTLSALVEVMHAEGAEGVILGCTELGMILKDEDVAIPLLDTVKIHSEAAVRMALEA